MPDSSAIDNALMAKLGADATLLAICTNGVYWDVAPPGSTKYVLVSLVDELDEPQFGGRAYEDVLYRVRAIALSTAGANLQQAAARIDALLEDGALSVSGYTHMVMYRESRIRETEPLEDDPTKFWFHRGGEYRVQMSI